MYCCQHSFWYKKYHHLPTLCQSVYLSGAQRKRNINQNAFFTCLLGEKSKNGAIMGFIPLCLNPLCENIKRTLFVMGNWVSHFWSAETKRRQVKKCRLKDASGGTIEGNWIETPVLKHKSPHQNAPTTSPLVVNFVIFGMHVLHTATWSEAWVVDMQIEVFASWSWFLKETFCLICSELKFSSDSVLFLSVSFRFVSGDS